MKSELLILIAEAMSVYFLVLWAHSLRHRFGLAHFYALIGGITAVMSWVTDAGVIVQVAGITFMVGSTVFYTSLLLAVFVVYVFDGVRATRIAISTVAGVSIMVPVIAVVLHLQMTISGHAPLGYVPMPSLRINTASVFATVADLIFLAMAWEFLGKPKMEIRLWLRAFLALLGVMWLDVLLFATGAFAGNPEYLNIMKGTLLSRLIVSVFACPFLYLYLNRQNKKMGIVIENRPVLAILKEIAEMREELGLAQREIERRKRAEEALRENQRLSTKAEIIGNFGYWDRDFLKNKGSWSEGIYRIFGVHPDKFRDSYEYFLSLVHPLDRERVQTAVADALHNRQAYELEYRIVRPDGKERNVHVVGEARFDVNGQAIGLFGTVHDITDRKRAEEALRESEDRHRQVSDLIADYAFSCVKHQGGEFTTDWLVGALEKITGYSIEEVFNKGCWRFFVHPVDMRVFEKNVIGLRPGERGDCELRITRKDGSIRWIRVLTRASQDTEDPLFHRLFGSCEDISGRKEAEQSVMESRNFLETIIKAIADPIFVKDRQHRWILLNDSYCSFMGYSRGELIGKSDYDFFPASEADVFWEKDEEVFASGNENENEEQFTDAKNTIHTIITKKSRYVDAFGHQFLVGVIRDITERKLAEEKLKSAYKRLKITLNDTIVTISKIVEIRDPYTAGHQQRVTGLAIAIAKEMNLESKLIDQLRMAALIHDIGKINIASEILNKPGNLNSLELQIIMTHAQSGYEIVRNMNFLPEVAQTILQHHERLDGSGYPNGLKGDNIRIEAKILSVADVIESMASHRPYRPARGIELALAEISKNSGTSFDSEVCIACLRLFNDKGFRFDFDHSVRGVSNGLDLKHPINLRFRS